MALVVSLAVSLGFPYTAECLCRSTDPLTRIYLSAQEENQMKRCVHATVITPNAPIVSLRLEINLDMALRLELVGAFVQGLASTTATQPTGPTGASPRLRKRSEAMSDAKARAAARREAILAKKSDRLAKFKTTAKEEGAGPSDSATDGKEYPNLYS